MESEVRNKTVNNPSLTSLSELFTPPGGILIWLFVLVELLAFGFGFFAVQHLRAHQTILFLDSQQHLNFKLGLVFTLLLLTSGWLLAESVHEYFTTKIMTKQSAVKHRLAIILGVGFLILKFFDFSVKIKQGYVLGSNSFWDTYWLLTGFHFVHVFIGIILLILVHFNFSQRNFEDEDFAVRGSALFWHMCDLAWIFLFPLFYLRMNS